MPSRPIAAGLLAIAASLPMAGGEAVAQATAAGPRAVAQPQPQPQPQPGQAQTGPVQPARVATVPATAAPPVQPPALSPQEQAALDQLLAAWEARNAAVRTWACNFHKWEYNAWSPADEAGEHWVCNGESIYEFRHTDRQLRETKLPPEMRGKAISDGPLPFVFGAKAETLKKRYWMRLITPREVTDQIWLESLPRFQADAANFAKVELILQARDLMPFAIQIHKPGGQDRDVYQFDPKTNLIDKGLDLIRDFARPVTPFGYTYILEDASAPQAQPQAGQRRP
jgi:hypothetical protein